MSRFSALRSMTRPGPSNWLLAVLYAGMIVAWGLNFIFVKIGLASSPPLWLAAVRTFIGIAGIAAGMLIWRSDVQLTGRERRDALLLGIPTTGVFFGLWFSAATQVPPGETAVVVYTFPLWVVVLSFLLLGERARGWAWASVVVGFLGVVLIEQPWTGASGPIPPTAIGELLGAAAGWALGTVLLKSRIRGGALRTANVYQLLSGGAVLLVVAVLFEPHPVISITPALIASLLWVGLVGTSLAYAVWFMLLQRFPASTVSTWAFLTPVVALVASVVIFGERLNALQIVGVAAVLAGAFVIARTAPSEFDPVESPAREGKGPSVEAASNAIPRRTGGSGDSQTTRP